ARLRDRGQRHERVRLPGRSGVGCRVRIRGVLESEDPRPHLLQSGGGAQHSAAGARAGKACVRRLDRHADHGQSTAATTRKSNPVLQPGAICYMMSKAAYLTDGGDHNLSHLMLYTPSVDGASLGADAKGSPVIMGQHSIPGAPAPVTEFYVAVPTWSDGTAVRAH